MSFIFLIHRFEAMTKSELQRHRHSVPHVGVSTQFRCVCMCVYVLHNAGLFDGDFGQLKMHELIFPKLIFLLLCNMVPYNYADLI